MSDSYASASLAWFAQKRGFSSLRNFGSSRYRFGARPRAPPVTWTATISFPLRRDPVVRLEDLRELRLVLGLRHHGLEVLGVVALHGLAVHVEGLVRPLADLAVELERRRVELRLSRGDDRVELRHQLLALLVVERAVVVVERPLVDLVVRLQLVEAALDAPHV